MVDIQILLNTVEKIKKFVSIISTFDCNFDLISGRYVIDAKSIMGIFSMDISKPIHLVVHTNDSKLQEECKTAIAEFII